MIALGYTTQYDINFMSYYIQKSEHINAIRTECIQNRYLYSFPSVG